MKKYQIYGLGNALVDYEYAINEEFIQEFQLIKGLMTLVDQPRQEQLFFALGEPKKKQCGGSAANTIVAASQFGSKCFYSCRVGQDTTGNFFLEDLQHHQVDSNLKQNKLVNGNTGKCLIMVTSDAQRTMNTYLGCSSDFSVDDLDFDAISQSEYIYLEGYLVSSPTAREAALEAKKWAEKKGVMTSITLSDPNMVKFFKGYFIDLIGASVDLLFCNEEEALMFTETYHLQEAIQKLKSIAKHFVITKGTNGAVIYDGDTLIDISAYKVHAIDSNGAGDMFAGAFLHAITHGQNYAGAGKIASLAASKVVSQFGPRLQTSEILSLASQI